ncbi:MAG: type II toxin-antitoxin system PemK/MazF family toxin [Propionibacteriaceae bacterium]|jgi:mRNA interferase MazF|nr:type II toxin-antitoxin system PemK/MazF family toxin [Propionibacteriaceae bacterium]
MTTGTEAASEETASPRRGEVWLARLGAAQDGEPGKNRPVLVVAANGFAPYRPSDLLPVVPISASRLPSPSKVPVSGDFLDRESVAVCRAIRGVARSRLLRPLGELDATSLAGVDRALRRTLAC